MHGSSDTRIACRGLRGHLRTYGDKSVSKLSLAKPQTLPGQPHSGRIGIFWWFAGRLLASTCRVEQGIAGGGSVDSQFSHVETWRVLQRRYPKLRTLDYEDVSRGRVVYLHRSKRFRVLMDKVLFQPHIQTTILKRFGLPKSRTRFLTDQHYTTDPKEIERLFDDREGNV